MYTDNNKKYSSGHGFSPNDPIGKEKNKSSLLTYLLICLLILFICSLCYDNILKPYLARQKENMEKQQSIITKGDNEVIVETPYSADDYDNVSPSDVGKTVEEKDRTNSNEQTPPSKEKENTVTNDEDDSNLSTIEILERRNHADVVKRARKAGVSTEGSTIEILERINHADVVKRARKAGVSTEGSTIEILERINRKNLERIKY